MIKFNETQSRSIVKSISWRILQTISHIVNGFIVTGSLLMGLKIAGLAAIINSILYWIHERVWNLNQWNRKPDENVKFSEGQSRFLSKMISWRIIVTITNFIIPFILTGSWGEAALFTGMATLVNMFLFWGHENLWNRIKWGKKELITHKENSSV